VLFGAINPRTGRRLILRRDRQRQGDFQAFLRYLRRHYGGRPLWLLLDQASIHIAAASQRLARELDVTLLWLPKQCPELNAQDHLWKELKRRIVANRQFDTIDDEADHAEHWLLEMTPTTALRKAGIRGCPACRWNSVCGRVTDDDSMRRPLSCQGVWPSRSGRSHERV
jgi:transposase